jgi:predicted glycoside hydrolase/deacetylase ChbG (UPF0249 family)
MKYLIVNADDFGMSAGVTRGILEAHRAGFLTSTSFMVDAPSARDAAQRAREAPRLSVGLHAEVPQSLPGLDATAAQDRCRAELERQIARFRELLGRAPTHLDSHHNRHRERALAPAFVEVASRHEIPLRGNSAARTLAKFYGQWGGRSHPEQIGFASLATMLETEIQEGLTELSCHPGYADLDSSYNVERELELRTLCDERLSGLLEELDIKLVSYHDFGRIANEVGSRGEEGL